MLWEGDGEKWNSFLGKQEGEGYSPGYRFCKVISASAKTEFLCKREYP